MNNLPPNKESLPLPVSGIILCGGKSTRMGRTKAFLPFAGKTLIEHRLDSMQEIFSEVFLVTNDPDSFAHLSTNVVKDIVPNRGPLVGILSGLLVSLFEHSFVVPCDMPLINKELFQEMANKRHGVDVLAFQHGEVVEPLIGIYSKRCIEALEKAIFHGQESDFAEGITKRTFDFETKTSSPAILPPYFNVDTPYDYGMLCRQV